MTDHFTFFSGASLEQICEDAGQVRGKPGAQMQVRGEGKHMTIRFVCADYTGNNTNESHVCPGDPACP